MIFFFTYTKANTSLNPRSTIFHNPAHRGRRNLQPTNYHPIITLPEGGAEHEIPMLPYSSREAQLLRSHCRPR